MKDDTDYLASEARRTQEYINAHPPLISNSLIDREIFRIDMEIAALDRLKKIFEEALEVKRAKIQEIKERQADEPTQKDSQA